MESLKVPYVDFQAQFLAEKDSLIETVRKVFERGNFILGEDVSLFEEEFAKLCRAKHAIAVANGTDALILAMKVLGIGAGDEVITSSNSWVSSASAIALVGATPVFADVQKDQNLSPEAVEKAITKKTKAILPVHLTGRCANLTRFREIADRNKLFLIEDAAQAILSEVDGKRAGQIGDINCFSLHPLKNLNAAGDAGIITTQNDKYANTLRMLRNHGLKNRDEIEFWGYNSRLDTLQAAILRTRIPTLKSTIQKRREIAQKYISKLREIVDCPLEEKNEFHTYHVFAIQCDRRDELKSFLFDRGIGTKIHYPIPIHLQNAAKYLEYSKGSLPETERQADRILSLPVNQYLTDKQVDWVCTSIRDFYST